MFADMLRGRTQNRSTAAISAHSDGGQESSRSLIQPQARFTLTHSAGGFLLSRSRSSSGCRFSIQGNPEHAPEFLAAVRTHLLTLIHDTRYRFLCVNPPAILDLSGNQGDRASRKSSFGCSPLQVCSVISPYQTIALYNRPPAGAHR